jgi:hypothetical protein
VEEDVKGGGAEEWSRFLTSSEIFWWGPTIGLMAEKSTPSLNKSGLNSAS